MGFDWDVLGYKPSNSDKVRSLLPDPVNLEPLIDVDD